MSSFRQEIFPFVTYTKEKRQMSQYFSKKFYFAFFAAFFYNTTTFRGLLQILSPKLTSYKGKSHAGDIPAWLLCYITLFAYCIFSIGRKYLGSVYAVYSSVCIEVCHILHVSYRNIAYLCVDRCFRIVAEHIACVDSC